MKKKYIVLSVILAILVLVPATLFWFNETQQQTQTQPLLTGSYLCSSNIVVGDPPHYVFCDCASLTYKWNGQPFNVNLTIGTTNGIYSYTEGQPVGHEGNEWMFWVEFCSYYSGVTISGVRVYQDHGFFKISPKGIAENSTEGANDIEWNTPFVEQVTNSTWVSTYYPEPTPTNSTPTNPPIGVKAPLFIETICCGWILYPTLEYNWTFEVINTDVTDASVPISCCNSFQCTLYNCTVIMHIVFVNETVSDIQFNVGTVSYEANNPTYFNYVTTVRLQQTEGNVQASIGMPYEDISIFSIVSYGYTTPQP